MSAITKWVLPKTTCAPVDVMRIIVTVKLATLFKTKALNQHVIWAPLSCLSGEVNPVPARINYAKR
jgi:hypothetical protein